MVVAYKDKTFSLDLKFNSKLSEDLKKVLLFAKPFKSLLIDLLLYHG